MSGYLNSFRRVGALALAVVITLTCVPLFGPDLAYALDDEYEEREVTVVKLSKEEQKAEKDKAEAKAMAEMGVIDDLSSAADVKDMEEAAKERALPQEAADQISAPAIVDKLSKSDAHAGDVSIDGGKPTADREGTKNNGLTLQGTELPDIANVTLSGNLYTNGNVVVEASVNEAGWTFSRMCMNGSDETIWDTDIEGVTSFSQTFNIKDYAIGYHTFILRFCYNGEEVSEYYYWDHIERPIFDEVPSIKYSDFTTRRNYIKYYNAGNYYSEDYDCGVSIEYKKGSGAWKQGPAPVDRYYEKKKTGLKAASTYKVRARYCKVVTYDYDGKDYLHVGPVSKTLTLKTPYKKPKVRKIDISKVKVRCRKYRYWTGKIRQRWLVNARTGQRIRLIKQWKIYRTVRSYSTRYKVTVKFRKKQGVAGIQIHTSHGYTVWLGGNKKSYSKTFTVSGKKKNRKLRVSVKSRMSKKYDSWSGTYSKRVRIR